jgi:hypothetical protein
MNDRIVAALATVSPGEARAVIEALAQWVENEQTRDDGGGPSPYLSDAEALLERLNGARATTYEPLPVSLLGRPRAVQMVEGFWGDGSEGLGA